MEPNVPLALRRLRHAEYFAFMSKGTFASIDTSSSPSNNNTKNNNNNASPESTMKSPQFQQQQDSSSSSSTAFKSFFPYETSCCRMEILLSSSSSSTSSTKNEQQQEDDEKQSLLLYRSEPVAPTRHPRFAPLPADVRTIGDSVDSITIRVLAEKEDSEFDSYVTVDHTPDAASFENNNSLAAVLPVSRTRGSSTIQAATVTVTKFFADHEDDDDQVDQNNDDRPINPFESSNGTSDENNRFKSLKINQLLLQQENSNQTQGTTTNFDSSYNLSPTSANNSSSCTKLMKEFKIKFSNLEYVADSLHEAYEILRYRFSKEQQENSSVNNNNTMECLIACSDGVFIINHDSFSENNGNKNLSKAELLKRFGNEKLKAARKNGENGGGGKDNNNNGEAWDVVVQTQDPDRCDDKTVKSMINSTLTMHYAELVLKRRTHLEKQRLIENMKMQMTAVTDEEEENEEEQEEIPAEKEVAAPQNDDTDVDDVNKNEEETKKNQNDDDGNEEQQNEEKKEEEQQEVVKPSDSTTAETTAKVKTTRPRSRTSIKRELAHGYRQLELEDIRRQIETAQTQLQQQSTLSDLLQEQLRSRKLALEGRRREVNDKSKRVKQLRETAEDDLDSATKLERQLRLCRSKVLSGMSKLFPITVNAPHSICGFNIPHNEPQNEVHACALGCIVHAVVTFCSVHGHVPLHPLLSQASRSSVAEYVGAPASKVFPLYATNATEKEQSTKAVMLLRRVMAHAAFAIHNQRQANDLPFGIALQKLLFNR